MFFNFDPLQITSLQKSLQSIPNTSASPTTSAIAPSISTGNHTHHLSPSSSSLPLHMLSRPTTSSAPLDQSTNIHQTSSPSLSVSSTSRNNGIIDIWVTGSMNSGNSTCNSIIEHTSSHWYHAVTSCRFVVIFVSIIGNDIVILGWCKSSTGRALICLW